MTGMQSGALPELSLDAFPACIILIVLLSDPEGAEG